jgi:hypothetical protein
MILRGNTLPVISQYLLLAIVAGLSLTTLDLAGWQW